MTEKHLHSTNKVNNSVQDNSQYLLLSQKDFHFDFLKGEPCNIHTSVGKDYLYRIIDTCIADKEDTAIPIKNVLYNELNDFIRKIENKDNILKLNLFPELEVVLNKGVKEKEPKFFTYLYMKHYMVVTYSQLKKDILKGNKINTWVKFTPQIPEDKFNLEDTPTNYQSIMCNFSLKRYRKYKGENAGCEEGWTYALSTLYLVILNKMYEMLRYHVCVEEFVDVFFEELNPVITGMAIELQYSLGEMYAVSVLHELSQLHSSGKHLTVTNKPNSVELIYTSKDSFQCTLGSIMDTTYNDARKRRYISLVASCAGHILNLRITAIGLGTVAELTGLGDDSDWIALDKSLYALITCSTVLDCIGYHVLRTMLSHTEEHKTLMKNEWRKSNKRWKEDKLRTVFENSNKKELVNLNMTYNTINNAFMELEPDMITLTVQALIQEFNLKENVFKKPLTAIMYARMDKKQLKVALKGLASKQHAEIMKMIQFVRKFNKVSTTPILNFIYRKVSYKC